MLSQRETRAFHEAGHAVVAWAVGARIELVTANETEDFLGHCMVASDATPHQLALIARGGAIAESKYTGRPEDELWRELLRDRECRDENDAACKNCSAAQHDQRARTILKNNYGGLESLARQVHRCPVVTGAEVAHILNENKTRAKQGAVDELS